MNTRSVWASLCLCSAILSSCHGPAPVPPAPPAPPPPRAPHADGLGPQPGDLFREHVWLDKMHVLKHPGWKERTAAQPAFQAPLPLAAAVDLTGAIGAEVVLEIANTHLGWEKMWFRVNGGAATLIPFPSKTPREPSPSRWFNYWFPAIAVPVSALRPTGNTIELAVGPSTYDGTNPHPAWEPLYAIRLRVYYDPARVPHARGALSSPVSGTTVGLSVPLRVHTSAPAGHAATAVHYVGRYEDLSYEGDGVYDRWHYQPRAAGLLHHLGSGGPSETLTWDTSWVPDQTRPMSVAAWVTDATGLVHVTEAATGLRLDRPGISVELARPYDVPVAFTSCQYGKYIGKGAQTAKFDLYGDPSFIEDARFALVSFNGGAAHGFAVNETTLEDAKLEGAGFFHHLSIVPLRPLSALRKGTNTFSLLPGGGRSSDAALPGPMILVRYRRP